MPDNTDSPPGTGDIPFQFGLDTRTYRPDTFHLSLLMTATGSSSTLHTASS